MILCDIGNSTYSFFEEGRIRRKNIADFQPQMEKRRVFYINVNDKLVSELSSLPNWIDLRPHVTWHRYYPTMGIDRVVACEAIDEGVVVDAGSAITVDVVKEGRFEGGFIYPGLSTMATAYASISSNVAYAFNEEIVMDKLPKSSRDSVSYGALIPLVHEIERLGKPLYVTGGDARTLMRLLPDAILDETLLFRGMRKIIENAHLIQV